MANWTGDEDSLMDFRRDWLRYERPDEETPEEIQARLAAEEERGTYLSGVVKWS